VAALRKVALPHAFISQPTSSFAADTFCSALVFEKWRDERGQAWAHVTFNGIPCVMGDAVARQVRHPALEEPLHVMPMEVFELALEQVRSLSLKRLLPPLLVCTIMQPSQHHVPQPLTLSPQHTSLIKTIGIERLCRVRHTSHILNMFSQLKSSYCFFEYRDLTACWFLSRLTFACRCKMQIRREGRSLDCWTRLTAQRPPSPV
jgi:hypothetical protein